MFFTVTIAIILGLASCSKKAPEKITGEVRGFCTKILSDSVTVTVLSIDAEENGKALATIDITVDPKDSTNKKVIQQILDMSTYGYYQPVFARFKKLENFDYVCTEIAVMNYDVMVTLPVYMFQSDQHLATN
jgi:hypothetical protein